MGKEEFLRKERKILDAVESRGLEVREGKRGLEAKLPKKGFDYGYIVFLTYKNGVSKAIQEFSDKVNDKLGAITYGIHEGWGGSDSHLLSNVHTTIGIYSPGSGDLFKPDYSIIRTLGEATQEAITEGVDKGDPQRYYTPEVRFDRLIHDESTVLLRPTGDANTFYPFMHSVTSNARERGIDIKPAWGRHITVARFKKNIFPSKELTRSLSELFDYENIILQVGAVYDAKEAVVKKKEIFVEDYARSVNVGFFALHSSQFILEPCVSYHFNPIRSPGIMMQ